MKPRLHIGLPQWHHPAWHDSFLAGVRSPQEALKPYARSFSSVEGNTSFYGLPSEQSIQRWQTQVDEGFRFCFKFPREISHAPSLLGHEQVLTDFLMRVAPLKEKLGVLWLQLPATFSPARLSELELFLQLLPAGFSYAVEVRHRDFFEQEPARLALNQLLEAVGASRVIFDTRTLFAYPAEDRITQDALAKKPKVPMQPVATNCYPFVRLITPLNYELADSVLDEWVERLAQWCKEGREPYLFIHTPDNQCSPQVIARFAHKLETRLGAFSGFNAWPEQKLAQASLF